MERDETRRKAQGRRLRAARIDAGFRSMAEFSKAVGVADSTYRTHEYGDRGISYADAKKYADYLSKHSGGRVDISAMEILHGSKAMTAAPAAGRSVLSDSPLPTWPHDMVSNYETPEGEGERVDDLSAITTEVAAWYQANSKSHPKAELWIIRTNALSAIRLMPGDYVIVDRDVSRAPPPMTAVLGMHNGKPVFRSFQPPWLMPSSREHSEARPVPLDGVTAIVTGILIAFLPPPLLGPSNA